MSTDIRVGNRVRLLGMPDWLVHDLPSSEQVEMCGFIGQSCAASEIDAYGYYWQQAGTKLRYGVDGGQGDSYAIGRSPVLEEVDSFAKL